MEVIAAECVALGFKKRTSIFFTMDVSSEVLAGLAFAIHARRNLISVGPFAVVRHQPLEQLLAELSGQKFDLYGSGTLGGNIGYIPPLNEFASWEVEDGADPSTTIREISAAIGKVAVPWMRAHQDLPSFIADLKGFRFVDRDQRYLKLPVAYYLNSEFELARPLLTAALEEIGDEEGTFCDQYRTFATALLKRLPKTTA